MGGHSVGRASALRTRAPGRVRAALSLALLGACAGTAAPVREVSVAEDLDSNASCRPGETAELAPDLALRCVAPDVWVFTALASADFAHPRYPANGLLVERTGESVLVDTGWSGAQAEALARYAADVRGRPVRSAIVTHFHEDRVGGAAALAGDGVQVYALNETATRASESGHPFDHVALEPDSIPGLVWMYPGGGHSPENLVVWHAATGVLFAGCLVKELRATDLGNLSDADRGAWGPSIDLVRASFPAARVVVPGHGAPGDLTLLAHTLALVDPPECAADDECVVSTEVLESCTCCHCQPPRALAVREIEARLAERLSCEPICAEDRPCPACLPEEERARLVARCVAGHCAMGDGAGGAMGDPR